MQVDWYGQAAFRLTAPAATVFIDPFANMSALARRGVEFRYPPIEAVGADLVLVTHEHLDHNGVAAIDGSPVVLRSTAGRLASPIGEILAVASEHDAVAGTERGPNTIFVFELDGVRVCHFGDFGQRELRPEQADAIGSVDLLFVPVGGGPTIGGAQAAAIAARLHAQFVVPMHYRTARVNFLEPADSFLAAVPAALALDSPRFELSELPVRRGPLAVVPAVP